MVSASNAYAMNCLAQLYGPDLKQVAAEAGPDGQWLVLRAPGAAVASGTAR